MINTALIDCFSPLVCGDLIGFSDFNALKQVLSKYLLMLNIDLPSVKEMFMFILHSYPKLYKIKK